MLVNKVKEKGGKVKYILFEGEGHGFRKSENVKRAMEEELAWYEDVFSLGHRS
jgi:dipeptidyl aminopeptidase/acylaminoacyl peptidase